MGYDLRRRIAKQWEQMDIMVPEEEDVWKSLTQAGYEFAYMFLDSDERKPDYRDFTPTSVLYEAYRKYKQNNRDPESDDLTAVQFGVAFNAVTEGMLDRSRRWMMLDGKRKKVWGYTGVRGPKSIRLSINRDFAGRPRKDEST